ncbi:MAG: ATP-binding cassette domain-containing protein [Verrucomicrobiaceae bacterium]|nr:ATP-binding cassette domain-containing protein [Verrucomicrobiaceae bacterium]
MIQLENITWQTSGRVILDDVTLTLPRGAYAVLMGRTGCGKTTLLEILCGLRHPQRGRIRLEDRDVTDLEPRERGIGYLPQDLALFPGLRVAEQIGFALLLRGMPPEKRVHQLAEELGITALLQRMPDDLSGGEKQRVALARALAASPHILLLDEPLSALDEDMRGEAAAMLKRIQKEHRLTILHVTHSEAEAVQLAEVRLRMEGGKIRIE